MPVQDEDPRAGATMLDQDIETFVRSAIEAGNDLTNGEPVSIDRQRQIAEIVRRTWTAGGPAMQRSDDAAIGNNNLKVRVHVPETHDQRRGHLIYLHGGGWIMFSIDTHDRLMREYAHRSGLIVVGLDYSLSPEHRFPQALDDVDTLYAWLDDEHGESVRFGGKRFIGGDSAGANLALCSTLRRRDLAQSLPAGLILNYAAVDTARRGSHDRFDSDKYMLNSAEMADFWKAYLHGENTDDPYARPLLADLAGLPAIHMCIAECDILLDENVELRDRLIEAGCNVSSRIYEGATHSFLEAVRISGLADRAIQDAADWLAAQADGP
ncbi:MAG: alpha/beta hydrolase [Pseudomonadota bacterium]